VGRSTVDERHQHDLVSVFARQQPGFAGKDIVPISLVGNYPARIEARIKKIPDGKGGFIEKKMNAPVWIEPAFGGVTPMCGALRKAHDVIHQFILQNPNCFPPIVINITDGEASDGNPREPGQKLMSLKSSDGNALLFNLHISSFSNRTIQFPSNPHELPDDYAKELFNMSSPLTSYMMKVISDEGGTVGPGSRGFSFNADFNALLKFIEIGTRPKNLGSVRDELNQLFPST